MNQDGFMVWCGLIILALAIQCAGENVKQGLNTVGSGLRDVASAIRTK